MTGEQKERCLEYAKHAIGMDGREIYRTHGVKVFIPYRNYFTCGEPDELWELMIAEGYAEKAIGATYVNYGMTPNGIQWMVKELRINICLTY